MGVDGAVSVLHAHALFNCCTLLGGAGAAYSRGQVLGCLLAADRMDAWQQIKTKRTKTACRAVAANSRAQSAPVASSQMAYGWRRLQVLIIAKLEPEPNAANPAANSGDWPVDRLLNASLDGLR